MASFFTDGFGSGLISGGLGLISNAINNKRQKQAEQRQFNYQKELMSIENQQNIDFWNMNNEYNTPANQRARLEAAGLNPNLMYGNGATTTPATMPQASKGDAPGTGYSPIEGERMFLNAVQSANYRANTENILADADLKRETTITEQTKRDLMETERILNIAKAQGIDLDNKYLEKSFNDRLNSIILGNEEKRANIEFTDFSKEAKRLETDANLKLADAKISEIMNNNELSKANKAHVLVKTAYDIAVNEYFEEHEKLPSSSTLNELLMDILQQIAPPGTLSWTETKKAIAEAVKQSKKRALKEKFPIKK